MTMEEVGQQYTVCAGAPAFAGPPVASEDRLEDRRRHVVHPIRNRLPASERRDTANMLQRGAQVHQLQALPSAIVERAATWVWRAEESGFVPSQLERDVLQARGRARAEFLAGWQGAIGVLHEVHAKLASTDENGQRKDPEAAAVAQSLSALRALRPSLDHLAVQSAYGSRKQADLVQRAQHLVNQRRPWAEPPMHAERHLPEVRMVLFQLTPILIDAKACGEP